VPVQASEQTIERQMALQAKKIFTTRYLSVKKKLKKRFTG